MDRHHYEIFTKFGDDSLLLHIDNARGCVGNSRGCCAVLCRVFPFALCPDTPLPRLSPQVWETFPRRNVNTGPTDAVLRVSMRGVGQLADWGQTAAVHAPKTC